MALFSGIPNLGRATLLFYDSGSYSIATYNLVFVPFYYIHFWNVPYMYMAHCTHSHLPRGSSEVEIIPVCEFKYAKYF